MNPTTFVDAMVEQILERDADEVLGIRPRYLPMDTIVLSNGNVEVHLGPDTDDAGEACVDWTVYCGGEEITTDGVGDLDDEDLARATAAVIKALGL